LREISDPLKLTNLEEASHRILKGNRENE